MPTTFLSENTVSVLGGAVLTVPAAPEEAPSSSSSSSSATPSAPTGLSVTVVPSPPSAPSSLAITVEDS